MKKIYLFLLFVFVFAINARTQVKIGGLDNPERGAVLELQSDTLGFLPTRVTLVSLNLPDPIPVHVEGLVVYNMAGNLQNNLQEGLYYNTGTRWVRLHTSPPFTVSWFYMPSIAIDISTTPTATHTVNLYTEFVKQLNSTPGVEASAGAPTKVLSTIPAATDLYYYVTAYDPTVFQNISITAAGLMTYEVIGAATDETFMNIVFVEK